MYLYTFWENMRYVVIKLTVPEDISTNAVSDSISLGLDLFGLID